MPLRTGHILVIPKEHYKRVSALPPEYAAAVGMAVSKVARALSMFVLSLPFCAACIDLTF
jgi:diadenosine tetraphosphate (Ap4A) HIT family hydrolase